MRFLSVGEAMVELSPVGEGVLQRGFAGDTLNTAWYVQAALGHGVGFCSSVGQDEISSDIISFIESAGIDCSRVSRHKTRTLGLYLVSLKDGERSFSYWRDSSAAKTLADDPSGLLKQLAGVELIYVSGITFGILPAEKRKTLIQALNAARANGARVAFDPNLRPRLWETPEVMTKSVMEAAKAADIVLPSFDDEAAYFGDGSLADTVARYFDAGAAEVVVKNGGGTMLAATAGRTLEFESSGTLTPTDTTGAGDSFNGGYLAARMNHAPLAEALRVGDETARRVIMHRGALIPMNELLSH